MRIHPSLAFLIAAIVTVAIVTIYLRRKKKLYPLATPTDKALWRTYVTATCLGTIVFLFQFVLPTPVDAIEVTPNEPADVTIRKLVENENRHAEQLNEIREFSYVLCIVVGLCFVMAGGLARDLQANRKRELIAESPELKKPLGL